MSNEKTAKVVWSGDELQFHGTLGSGYEFELNSKSGTHGGSPMEFLLAGVAGCTAMDVISILQKMRQDVHEFSVEISGVRAEEHPKVYTEATITYIVRGHNLDEERVARAVELSEDIYCSASQMFRRSGTKINSSYRIEETAVS
ncbi:MAG: OsmC family protein [Ardenticatenaceae bacterium]|nr:OsmC family protein [Anaerolineales bacterium]MCB8941774.1 OsmC family protein [Ardenticatenaceae bacterium]MCB8972885.1 OsmC family protein [Ardenticatenaceae bacterium]